MDYGGYPVLIIPGYGAPAFQTELVSRHLAEGGLDTVKLKLPWLAMGDMTRSAELVAAQVKRVTEKLGFERVNFFGYSLGGLVARYYLQEMDGYPLFGRGAFVSAPHAGTYFGYLGFFSPAGRQVRPGSRFIRQLNESPLFAAVADRCLSMYVRWDGVIVPSNSAHLPYGYNLMRSRPISHWRAVMDREMILSASRFIRGEVPGDAMPGRQLALPEAGRVFAVSAALPVPDRNTGERLRRPFRAAKTRLVSLFRLR